MLTLNASVAAAILVGAIAATAGVTYVATKTSVTVELSRPNRHRRQPDNRGIPLGALTSVEPRKEVVMRSRLSPLVGMAASLWCWHRPFPHTRSRPAVA